MTTAAPTDEPAPRGSALAMRELPRLFERLHTAISQRRDLLDDLNVFPVPDGDTGTNMTLTVRSGLVALQAADGADEAAARAALRGALRGARGNSGVILSQVIRAVVEVLTTRPRMDASTYAQALTRARNLAYEAVATPVEGTILSVIAAAARAATVAAEDGHDLVETSRRACVAAAAAVEATRQQLDVLRAAGVVDAGARGFEVLLGAVHAHLTGSAPPVADDEVPAHDLVAGGCEPSDAAPYEVQYLLEAADAAASQLRHALERLGESVVVVAAGGLLNVHVHTAKVGPVIEAGLGYGTPSAIEVVHLGEQIAARAAARRQPARLGIVAVVDGAGMTGLAQERGAVVLAGGPGSLPSVAELYDAVVAADARQVMLLPGHRDIVPGAVQVAEMVAADREPSSDDPPVVVIDQAATPPALLAALAVADVEGDPASVVADVRAAAGAVRAGQVVAASHDLAPVGAAAGPYLALVGTDVVASTDDPILALESVLDALDADDAEVVTLLLGVEVELAEREELDALLHSWGDAEVELVPAGFSPARYWVGVE